MTKCCDHLICRACGRMLAVARGGVEGPLRRAQAGVVVCEGRVRGGEDGNVCCRSGRNGHDGVEVGWEGDHKLVGRKRQRLGGNLIEMSDEDDISIASDDAGDEDTIAPENRGDEQSPQTSSDQGTKRKGCGLPCCHALAVIAKANLWVYDYVHPIYKTVTQEVIYDQLVHPTETHDMGKVYEKTGVVVSGEELDDDYYRCILPSNNRRHPGRPSSKRIESQTQDKKRLPPFSIDAGAAPGKLLVAVGAIYIRRPLPRVVAVKEVIHIPDMTSLTT
ncbi:hypothetical protein Cgig2_004310 [Carnegiea gigantea]|uniref:Uncharacterized protein n=1 Tax=Carnegiea gigantea TaxID=171969 RepID=A0A9Q1K119_9CARY|nr:hypothetical protein Cgig2_004310 [Carnegiea gigantea]